MPALRIEVRQKIVEGGVRVVVPMVLHTEAMRVSGLLPKEGFFFFWKENVCGRRGKLLGDLGCCLRHPASDDAHVFAASNENAIARNRREGNRKNEFWIIRNAHARSEICPIPIKDEFAFAISFEISRCRRDEFAIAIEREVTCKPTARMFRGVRSSGGESRRRRNRAV